MKKVLFLLGRLFSFIPDSVSYYWQRVRIHFYTGLRSRHYRHLGKNTLLGIHTLYRGEKYISIGESCTIGDYGFLTAWDSRSGQIFQPEIWIGDGCTIGQQAHITAINSIRIGNGVLMGTKVLITDNSHGEFSYDQLEIPPIARPLYSKGPIVIEDNVWIGEKASILPNVHIGKGAIVAANSVVTKDVPAYSVVAGTPAVVIKRLEEDK